MTTFRIRFVVTAFVLFMAFPAHSQVASDPWLILADGKQGSINVQTTREDLVQAYGANNVVDQDVDVGEGDMEPVTILFPNAPERSIEIQWNDQEKKANPANVTIRGNKSRWKALHDISVGTTLKQLERLVGHSA